jgi:MFS family permease
MGGFTLTPKMLSEVSRLGPETVALAMVPRPLMFAIAGPVAGLMARRVTAKATVVFGTTMLVASLAAFSWVALDPKVGVVAIALALSGVGIGAVQPRLAATVANSVADEDLGVAGATQLLVAQIGTTLGMNLLEAVQSTTTDSVGLGGSYRVAYAVAAVVSAVGVLLALRMNDPADPARRRKVSPPDEPHHEVIAAGDDGVPVAILDPAAG